MKTEVKKWGNSLGLRIPKDITDELGIRDGSAVELEVRGNAVVITPTKVKRRRSRYDCDELMKGLSRNDLHPLEEWGPPVGKELW